MQSPRSLGRYVLHDELAAGGMATVHLGRLVGPAGFSRTVAIKRLHDTLARDPEFVSMFLDEARLAARIRHPNVVSTLDVVASAGELFLVMDYVDGESLARLLRAAWQRELRVPTEVAVSVMSGVLAGLHAAHEALSEDRTPLDIIHRDVSPQNVLLGVDGVPRVVDFGVAKAAGRVVTTRDGQLKGKLAYMPPEQIRGEAVDRRVDVYAASVVLWELLAGTRLFQGDEATVIFKVLSPDLRPPSEHNPLVPAALDEMVMKGLSSKPEDRFPTAAAMAQAIEEAVSPASARAVAEWVALTAGESLEHRAALVAEVEKSTARKAPSAGPRSRSLLDPDTHPLLGSRRGRPRRSRRTVFAAAAMLGALGAVGLYFGRATPVAPDATPTAPLPSAPGDRPAAPPTDPEAATTLGAPSASAVAVTPAHAQTSPTSSPTRVFAPPPAGTGEVPSSPSSRGTASPAPAKATGEPDYGF
jgi:serine/threonine protein kinase